METAMATARKQFFEVVNKHRCPNCRGAMVEVERIRENGYSFIWYECMRATCGGQWLEKHRVN